MKILLIDPYFKEGLKGFSLGLAYIAGALRKEHDISVLDLTARAEIERRNYKEILQEELVNKNPEIVGITSTSPTHKEALEVAKIVKQWKKIPIIKGGPHETNCAETTIKNNPEIDYSVIGEGEKTIIELVKRISKRQSVKGLEGVVFREEGIVINNGKRRLIQNLDTLPKPARDLFYLDKRFDSYYSAALFEGKKSTSIMTSRGCQYSCSFCSSKVNWPGKIRQRTPENVIQELEELYSQGFRGFMFEDDMSIADKNWFLEFARQIKQKELQIEYSLQTRVDAIDEEIAKTLSDSGCIFIYFGIESGIQEILNRCRKKITIEQAEKAFKIIRQYKIRSMASIQFGLPGEDLEKFSTIRRTIRVLNEKLKPDEVAISPTCLYPGSPLAIEEGVTPEMYENYIKTRADGKMYTKTAHGSYALHPKALTPEKIIKIIKIYESGLDNDIALFKPNRFYKT
ncbi:B12-binding domain-containing radical SAM protein [Candidatus Pacearchaeota archaeon]|nr:B12-binding domain-containing radical SAM protein [Candidatus Pacearchaeota archaeon]